MAAVPITVPGVGESITEISLVRDGPLPALVPNCHLHEKRSAGMVPVLTGCTT